ncbi:MAG: SCO family protein [Owenweeksia sp.]
MQKIKFYILFLWMNISCQPNGENIRQLKHLPYYNEATFTPHWLKPGAQALENFHRIPPFLLFNQNGDTITEDSLKGKVYVADFFFTSCPGICPKMTNNMLSLQDSFRHDPEVWLVSHSVTPEYDSIAVLKDYARTKGIDSDKWHLLTGDQELIYTLGRKAYFVEEDLGLEKEADEFLHTENFVLVDRQLHIRGIYNGLNKASIQQLIVDIHTLKQE